MISCMSSRPVILHYTLNPITDVTSRRLHTSISIQHRSPCRTAVTRHPVVFSWPNPSPLALDQLLVRGTGAAQERASPTCAAEGRPDIVSRSAGDEEVDDTHNADETNTVEVEGTDLTRHSRPSASVVGLVLAFVVAADSAEGLMLRAAELGDPGSHEDSEKSVLMPAAAVMASSFAVSSAAEVKGDSAAHRRRAVICTCA